MFICLYVYSIYICMYTPYTSTPYIYIYIHTPSNLLVDEIYLIVVAVISKLVYFRRAVTGK